jgi:hypothetical protein
MRVGKTGVVAALLCAPAALVSVLALSLPQAVAAENPPLGAWSTTGRTAHHITLELERVTTSNTIETGTGRTSETDSYLRVVEVLFGNCHEFRGPLRVHNGHFTSAVAGSGQTPYEVTGLIVSPTTIELRLLRDPFARHQAPAAFCDPFAKHIELLHPVTGG